MNGVVIIVGGEIKKSFIKKPKCVDSTEGTVASVRHLAALSV